MESTQIENQDIINENPAIANGISQIDNLFESLLHNQKSQTKRISVLIFTETTEQAFYNVWILNVNIYIIIF